MSRYARIRTARRITIPAMMSQSSIVLLRRLGRSGRTTGSRTLVGILPVRPCDEAAHHQPQEGEAPEILHVLRHDHRERGSWHEYQHRKERTGDFVPATLPGKPPQPCIEAGDCRQLDAVEHCHRAGEAVIAV